MAQGPRAGPRPRGLSRPPGGGGLRRPCLHARRPRLWRAFGLVGAPAAWL